MELVASSGVASANVGYLPATVPGLQTFQATTFDDGLFNQLWY
jgi:hypothetical protein